MLEPSHLPQLPILDTKEKLMLSLKDDVRIIGIRPELTLGIMIVHSVFQGLGILCVITSCTEGRHSRGSLHYAGAACDFRTRHLSVETRDKLYKLIKTNLGIDFDFVLEKDHFHMEYQPKVSY